MTENFIEILKQITAGIGITTLITLALSVLAKYIQNSKLQDFGYKFGVSLTILGSARIGKAWEKLEDFCINSIGQLLIGFKNGLKSDDGNSPPNDSNNNPDVGN